MVINDEIILKTPFVIRQFENINMFILTIFPGLKSYILDQGLYQIKNSHLESKLIHELERQFKLFIVQNYSKEVNEFINKQAKHADNEMMKQVIVSTISITLNLFDTDGHRLTYSDYLIPLRNIINKFDL